MKIFFAVTTMILATTMMLIRETNSIKLKGRSTII